MERGSTGKFETVATVGGEECRAFVPESLPPDSPLDIGPEMRELHYDTLIALGRFYRCPGGTDSQTDCRALQ